MEQCDDDPEILSILLNTLKSLIISKETVIEEHLDEFLTRLLKISTNNKSMVGMIYYIQDCSGKIHWGCIILFTVCTDIGIAIHSTIHNQFSGLQIITV